MGRGSQGTPCLARAKAPNLSPALRPGLLFPAAAATGGRRVYLRRSEHRRGAHRLFDGMPPPRRRNRKVKRLNPTAAATGGGPDLLSSLPEGNLHRVLYFLPPHEAVRTCVLARSWRVLWRSMPALRVSGSGGGGRWSSPADFNAFVNNLLLFRGRSPLPEFELYTYFHPQMRQAADEYEDSDEVVRYVDMWIRHAFMCDVQVLKVIGMSLPRPTVLVHVPLIAKQLRTLQLWSVLLDGCSMDFSRCQRLEDLMMDDCRISAPRMVSKSLKRLRVCYCDFSHDARTQICVTSLVSLQLDWNRGMTPFLERMPLLDRGLVRVGQTTALKDLDGRQTCALLESLSNAAYLELVAESRVLVNVPLIAKNLKILQLWSVLLDGSSMDFSRCETLEDLMMDDCGISAHRMVSKSLRRLRVCYCDFSHDTCTRISVPSLVSLLLDGNKGTTPFLESMPLLDTGLVRLVPTTDVKDLDGSQTCALLESLSNAAYLELVAESEMTIFKQDLKRCPAFSKLRTLILSDCVLGHDILALKVILQHAPILEKLILQLSDDHDYEIKMEESCSLVQQFPSEHLKVFEVRCRKDDEMVRKLEKMLKACGITSITFSLQEPGN